MEICDPDPCLLVVDDIEADNSCDEDRESLELESEVRPLVAAMFCFYVSREREEEWHA